MFNLGIKIVGGKSTVGGGDYGIFVKKVLAGGRVEAEGHLQEGDQLLEVNGESMVAVSNDKAISILRNAAESNNVKLLICRDSQARQEFISLMAALSGNALGSLNGPGAYELIRSTSRDSSRASTPSPTMEKRSWVMSAGRMSPLALGRHGSPNWSPSNSLDRPPPSLQRMHAVDLPSASELANPSSIDPPPYQNSNNLFHLNLASTPSSRNTSTYYMNGGTTSPKVSPKHCGTELQSDSEVTIDSGLQTDRHSSTPSPTFDNPGELQVIRIPITTGLGLCAVGGTNRPEGPHIYVDGMIEGGDAQMDNKLRQGDQLVTINGETLVGVTHEQAKSILTRLKLRKDLTAVEIAFIRGGNSGYIPSNQLVHSDSPVNGQEQEDDYVEQIESPPLSSRSSLDNGPEFNDSDMYLSEMPRASSGDSSGGMNRTSPQRTPHFIPNGAPYDQSAIPVSTYSVNTFPQPVSHVQREHPHQFVSNGSSLPFPATNGIVHHQPPPRHGGPTMSSTPNGLPNGQTLPMYYGQMNGYNPGIPPSSYPQHNGYPNETISPIGPSLQPSSVPFYLQQDLDALRRISEQYPSAGTHSSPRDNHASPGPPTTLSQRQRRTRADRSSRKLSLDPYTKIKVEKLEVALRYLGFDPSEDQQRMLRFRLPIDHNGCTTYGDFVNASREIFSVKLNEPNLNTSAFQFAIQDINAMEVRKMQQLEAQQAVETEVVARQTSDDLDRLRRERDEALREVQHLKKALNKKEHQCMESSEEVKKTRKQTQELLDESRSLKSRIHLASQAQEASKSVEQDYEEARNCMTIVINLLEKEVDDLKLKNSQRGPDPKDLEELQKRLVVLGCQLRKAEVSKRTYEVSTEKLIRFAEVTSKKAIELLFTNEEFFVIGNQHCHHDLVHDVLSRGGPEIQQQRGRGEPARRDTVGSKPPSYLARHAKHNSSTLAKEARDVVKSVKALIEEEPLPFGWEEAYTPDGVRYYINHVTQQTSWLHPVTHVQHLPPIMENTDEGGKETRT
ncbi:hypothetical protein QZH41_017920 [Actinostola sp. cb2023]|nr:hypothetical protein QZH41_017920 [Actinostola sp. cb2023]